MHVVMEWIHSKVLQGAWYDGVAVERLYFKIPDEEDDG